MHGPRIPRILLAVAVSSLAIGQATGNKPTSVAAAVRAPAGAPAHLPVKRVVLYKNGVGYFEHSGRVRGNEDVTIDFTTAQLNDVLNSLTLVDLGHGRITGVRYNSVAPLSQRLPALRLPLGERITRADFFAALRGARVEVRSGTTNAVGRILAVERTRKIGPRGEEMESTELTVVTDGGEVRSSEVTAGTSVRLLDRDVAQDVGRYLTLLGSTRDNDMRHMTISTAGSGERQLFIGYLSETPVWKSTYRILLSSKPDVKPLLQGWAVVDNTSAEDWAEVELSLISGGPQSFIQEISQPYYTRRPVVPLPESANLTPQTHEATVSELAGAAEVTTFAPGSGGLHGTVTDPTGASVANARVTVRNEISGASQVAITDARGFYTLSNVQAGNSAIFVEAAGFQRFQLSNLYLGTGRTNEVNAHLSVAAATETVEVRGVAPMVDTSNIQLSRAARELQVEASTRDVGDLFEYDLKQKITIGRSQSALVPIVQASVDAEKVTLWTEKATSALRALWIKNSSGLTLDGGSFDVLDDETFAGEGLLEPIKPGERRLVSYAVDQAVHIVVEGKGEQDDEEQGRVTRVRIAKGLMTVTREQERMRLYTVRNADSTARVVVLEHPTGADWKLAEGAKPEETSESYDRFRLNVEPGKTEQLRVQEFKPEETEYQLSRISNDQVELWLREKLLNPAIEQAFRQILAQKDVISQFDSELRSLQGEVAAIVADQSRLRENMKALKGSAEERALLLRYTRQLNDQEDRLSVLGGEAKELRQKRDKAEADLDLMVESVTLGATQ